MSIKKFLLNTLTLLFFGVYVYAANPEKLQKPDWKATLINENGTQNAYFI